MLSIYPQDPHLTENQSGGFRCGDNGIFRGVPLTDEQKELSSIAREIYGQFPSDGKYILNGERLIICQSNANSAELARSYPEYHTIVNPLGDWSGGTDVDTGATNRKLGSDMADSVTGGGLHGKDLSKADVSLNIYTFLKAQETGKPVELCCAIGDEEINGIPYADIVEQARGYSPSAALRSLLSGGCSKNSIPEKSESRSVDWLSFSMHITRRTRKCKSLTNALTSSLCTRTTLAGMTLR